MTKCEICGEELGILCKVAGLYELCICKDCYIILTTKLEATRGELVPQYDKVKALYVNTLEALHGPAASLELADYRAEQWLATTREIRIAIRAAVKELQLHYSI